MRRFESRPPLRTSKPTTTASPLSLRSVHESFWRTIPHRLLISICILWFAPTNSHRCLRRFSQQFFGRSRSFALIVRPKCWAAARQISGGFSVAFFFLAGWAYTFGQGTSGDSFPLFLWSGIIGIGVGDVALFQALPRLGSRVTVLLIQCLSTPLAALIEWLWLGTKLTGVQMFVAELFLAAFRSRSRRRNI